MEKVTLGGERLGSGKKMKVELHNYERSTHDLSYLWRSSMSAGTLVPFLKKLVLPGDTFDINLGCDIKTHPTIGPLFGSYKVQLDVFIAPIRLYNSMLHNNTLGIGRDMSKVKLPLIRLTAKKFSVEQTPDLDNSQINPSCLLSYLGIRGIGFNPNVADKTRDFNAVPILMLWDAYKNYYANKQEGIGAVIHTPATTPNDIASIEIETGGNPPEELPLVPATGAAIPLISGTKFIVTVGSGTPDPSLILINITPGGTQLLSALLLGDLVDIGGNVWEGLFNQGLWGDLTAITWRNTEAQEPQIQQPAVATFDLENIDEMRKYLLATWDETAPIIINGKDSTPYKWLYEYTNNKPNALSSQEGLPVKTYNSDLYNNWLKTENIEAISAATAVSTIGDSFTIDALMLSKKVYNMLNRIEVSGGSYYDWLDAVWMHDRVERCESPVYLGGLIKELVFQEVVSNSQTSEQPLGTLAGKGILSNKHKGGTVIVKVDEPSYVLGLISLTPRIDYSQGNDWDMHLRTMNDLHKPALDEIGFEDLMTEGMAWWDTVHNGTTWVQKAAGKQPAWINYMTSVNRTYGNFAIATNEMFMTLNRRYENVLTTPAINDLTTYIDPAKFNHIFAETALDAQNFWAQIAVEITARRKMSAKIMPNL